MRALSPALQDLPSLPNSGLDSKPYLRAMRAARGGKPNAEAMVYTGAAAGPHGRLGKSCSAGDNARMNT
jgi:hypothetical protein